MRVYLGMDPITGRKRWKSKVFHGGSRRAGDELAAFVTEHKGDMVPIEKTIGWLIDTWLVLQENAGLSPTTLRTYGSYLENWIRPNLGDVPVDKLTAGDLRELHALMTKDGKKSSTIRQVHHIIRGALTYAMEKEWHDRNVAAIRTAPKQSQTVLSLATQDEIGQLLKASGDPGSDLWTCIALAATLGARVGELSAIRWSDVDLAVGTVSILRSAYVVKGGVGEKAPKSGKGRVLDIDEITQAVLTTRWAWQMARWQHVHGGPRPTELVEDPYVLSFFSDGSGPPVPTSYTRRFSTLRDSLKMKHLHLHSLRHFMVSYMGDQGVPLAVIAERAGHSSPAVTARIYTHAALGRGREAAEIMGRVLPEWNHTVVVPELGKRIAPAQVESGTSTK